MVLVSPSTTSELVRERLTTTRVIGVQLCGRWGSGKTSLVEHVAASVGCVHRIGMVTPALPSTLTPAPTLDEVGIWHLTKGSELTAEGVLDLVTEMPLASLDFLFMEANLDPACHPPHDLGCHARGLVVAVSGGASQIIEAHEAIHRCHFVLFTQIDLKQEAHFDVSTARAMVHEIQDNVPVFLVSHSQHSEWLEWLSYLEELRRTHLPDRREEPPSSDLYLG